MECTNTFTWRATRYSYWYNIQEKSFPTRKIIMESIFTLSLKRQFSWDLKKNVSSRNLFNIRSPCWDEGTSVGQAVYLFWRPLCLTFHLFIGAHIVILGLALNTDSTSRDLVRSPVISVTHVHVESICSNSMPFQIFRYLPYTIFQSFLLCWDQREFIDIQKTSGAALTCWPFFFSKQTHFDTWCSSHSSGHLSYFSLCFPERLINCIPIRFTVSD